MTTDLFFSPTLPQKLPSSFLCDKAGSGSPDPLSKTASPDSSRDAEHETFSTTLRKVSRDRNPSEGSRQSVSTAADRSEKTDRRPVDDQVLEDEPAGDDILNDIMSLLGKDEVALNDETQLAADLNQLIALLEELGLKVSSGAEGAVENMSSPADTALDSLAALKQLLGTIESNDQNPGNEMTTGLKRLRHLIAQAMIADTSVHNHSGPKDGLNSTPVLDPNQDMRAAAEANAGTKDIKGQEMVPGEAGDSNRNADFSRLLASAGKGPRSGAEPPMENSLTGESSPVSKLINDAQVEKENPFKGDITPGDDAGSKVVKLEAGTSDSGQLTSQNQTFDKALESASAPKEGEAAQRELRTQTMEQIVRRAVIQVRNGQHEARIDLKPDFMGHVRMQVITENQQVTVKILTEFGFVKDQIENSIQQLKANLQQQGLEVDKIDVSVSRDSQGNKHPQENTADAKNLHREDKSSDHGNDREGQQERPNRSPLRAEGLATVDYFA